MVWHAEQHAWKIGSAKSLTLNQACPLKPLSTYALSTALQASRNSSCSVVTAEAGMGSKPSTSPAAKATDAKQVPI